MKYTKVISAVSALLLLCGCTVTSTLDWTPPLPDQRSSSGAKVVWNLEGYNNGVYLFYWIPLWSGKSSRPNRREYKTFQHHINIWDMRRLLNAHLKELKADRVEDIEWHESSSGFWSLWIFWKRSISATGVAVKETKNRK